MLSLIPTSPLHKSTTTYTSLLNSPSSTIQSIHNNNNDNNENTTLLSELLNIDKYGCNIVNNKYKTNNNNNIISNIVDDSILDKILSIDTNDGLLGHSNQIIDLTNIKQQQQQQQQYNNEPLSPLSLSIANNYHHQQQLQHQLNSPLNSQCSSSNNDILNSTISDTDSNTFSDILIVDSIDSNVNINDNTIDDTLEHCYNSDRITSYEPFQSFHTHNRYTHNQQQLQQTQSNLQQSTHHHEQQQYFAIYDTHELEHDDNNPLCPICFDIITQDSIATPDTCMHVFCYACLYTWSNTIKQQQEQNDRQQHNSDKSIDTRLPCRCPICLQSYSAINRDTQLIKWHEIRCTHCNGGDDDNNLLLCDNCNSGTHLYCIRPKPLRTVPEGSWYCIDCRIDIEGHFGPSLHAKDVRRQIIISTYKATTDTDSDNDNDIQKQQKQSHNIIQTNKKRKRMNHNNNNNDSDTEFIYKPEKQQIKRSRDKNGRYLPIRTTSGPILPCLPNEINTITKNNNLYTIKHNNHNNVVYRRSCSNTLPITNKRKPLKPITLTKLSTDTKLRVIYADEYKINLHITKYSTRSISHNNSTNEQAKPLIPLFDQFQMTIKHAISSDSKANIRMTRYSAASNITTMDKPIQLNIDSSTINEATTTTLHTTPKRRLLHQLLDHESVVSSNDINQLQHSKNTESQTITQTQSLTASNKIKLKLRSLNHITNHISTRCKIDTQPVTLHTDTTAAKQQATIKKNNVSVQTNNIIYKHCSTQTADGVTTNKPLSSNRSEAQSNNDKQSNDSTMVMNLINSLCETVFDILPPINNHNNTCNDIIDQGIKHLKTQISLNQSLYTDMSINEQTDFVCNRILSTIKSTIKNKLLNA